MRQIDQDYFIRVIIEGRDNLSRTLAKAAAEVKAFRSEMQGMDHDVSRSTNVQRQHTAAVTQDIRALRGSESAIGGNRNASQQAARSTDDYRRMMKGLGVEVESVATRFSRSRRETSFWDNALRGTQRSLFDTRRGVRDMDATMRRLQGSGFEAFYNLTRGADNFAKSFFRMNTIMAFIAPLIFTVVTAVLNLAAALVSVASAATMAAAALGGALLAGLTQLVPVVGLLIAAFHRLSLVMQASQMLTKGTATAHTAAASAAKTHREAAQRLADAQYSLSQAYQNVKDQAYSVRQAEQSLADARRQAARDLVDIQFAATDALLAQKDATLSLLEAKRRLAEEQHRESQNQSEITDTQNQIRLLQQQIKAAQARGDAAAVADLTAQLGAAQSNLEGLSSNTGGNKLDLRRAQLDVAEATQRKREADIAAKRAIEDRNRAEALGLAMAPRVVQAQHQLAQAIQAQAQALHDLARAQREVQDAQTDVAHPTAAGGTDNAYERLVNRLDPTERQLLQTIQKFKKLWEKATQPLTDAILSAISRALVRAETLFRDSKFMGALQGLANTIGHQIDRLSKFFTSGEQKKFFEQFAHLASKNLPLIITILEQVIKLVEKIGIAFAPVLEHILKATSGLFGRELKKSDQPANPKLGEVGAALSGPTKLESFAARSQTYLDSLAHFLGAIIHFLGAVISVAAPSGKNALDEMAEALNRWAKELRGVKREAAQEFFQRALKVSGEFFQLIGRLIGVLFKATQNKGFDAFIKVLSGPGVNALGLAANIYGKLFEAIAVVANAPGLGKLIEVFGALYVLSKITPFGGILRAGLGKGIGAALGTGAPALNESAVALSGAAGDLTLAATALERSAITRGGVVLPPGVKGVGGTAGKAGKVGGLAGLLGIGGLEAEGGILGASGLAAAAPFIAIAAAVAAAVAGLVLLLKYTGHLHQAWVGVKEIVKPIIDAVFIKPFQIIYDIWTGKWSKLWHNVVALFKDIFVTPWKGLWNLVQAIGFSFIDVFKDHWRGFLHVLAIITGGPLGDAIYKNAGKIWDAIKSGYQTMRNFFVKDVPQFFTGLANAVWDKASDLGKALVWPFNKMIDAYNWVKKNLHLGFLPSIHKIEFSGPSRGGQDLGSHADGAIVKAVPGGVYRVAEAGHDEAVIPLDPTKRMRALGLLAETHRRLGVAADFADGGIASPVPIKDGYGGAAYTGLTEAMKWLAHQINSFGARIYAGWAPPGTHSPHSHHYAGQALDIQPLLPIWQTLQPTGGFAELFGPMPLMGLYHHFQRFTDTKLQRQHQDHIHAAYLGTLNDMVRLFHHPADKHHTIFGKALGAVGSGAGAVAGAAADAAKFTLKQVRHLIATAVAHLPEPPYHGPFSPMMHGIIHKVHEGIIRFIKGGINKHKGQISGGADPPLGGSYSPMNFTVTPPIGHGPLVPVPGQPRSWLARALGTTGLYTSSNLTALSGRMMQESGGDPTVVNESDSNWRAGDPSRGLLQTTLSTFNQYHTSGLNNIWHPVHNAIAAVRYMMAKYGHIVGPSGTGYEDGGPVSGYGGEGAPVNATVHVGEWVLNKMQQLRLVRRFFGGDETQAKTFLFAQAPETHPGDRGGSGKKMPRKLKWPGYFGPELYDFGDDSSNGAARKGTGPWFIETPLGDYLQLGGAGFSEGGKEALKFPHPLSVLREIREKHGFWLPDRIRRRREFHIPHRALNAWKRLNIAQAFMASNLKRFQGFIGAHGGVTYDVNKIPKRLIPQVNKVFRSHHYNYARGGVVGFQPAPAMGRVPSFAAGGIVTSPSTGAISSRSNQIEQNFHVESAEKDIDIDYIMRVAKMQIEAVS